ncbi:MAG: ribosome maturation factor RimP [Rhodoferax sp.]|jgi:ribosome maturation factor RimP|nr:ribosome maturation factor RimP [Rhodoferax sp.]MBP9929566.1 ribosome maturation factor RimP [Rhodoferax sp.]HQX57862.1 ribosome maturation factor RimP [Burkholderiaceae bacterium]HQZ07235.1 ribosome maturation factor RimP [Burkholderiaceae bacterium]
MALQQIVEQTVTGLGYELIEIERLAGGLLRVTIDWPWVAPAQDAPLSEPRFVTVEDCETVTRQLLFALEVDAIEYSRLEVSSPGIDRLLRNAQDFERFLGHEVDVTLKAPVGAAALGQVNANRKKFRGTLERGAAVEGGAEQWQLVWSDPQKAKPGQRISKNRPPAPVHALGFSLDEIREARLAPLVNFKGRGASAAPDGV